jgi:Condensin complex subunit 2
MIADDANAGTKPKARRDKKEAFKIDFLTPPDPNKDLRDISKEMFAPVTKGTGINLPGTGATAKKGKRKLKEKRDDHRLPDDMHFSSKQLVTLFLKPKFFVRYFSSLQPFVYADASSAQDAGTEGKDELQWRWRSRREFLGASCCRSGSWAHGGPGGR